MPKSHKLLVALALLLPFAAIASLWGPVYLTFQGAPRLLPLDTRPAGGGLLAAEAQQSLASVMSGAPFHASKAEPEAFVRVADDLLAGKIDFSPLDPHFSHPEGRRLRLPFDAELVSLGDSSWQLTYAGFSVPAVLLRAYDATGREAYLAAARDFMRGWWAFERTNLITGDFTWNDHAVASRALVIGHFWHRYRNSALFDAADAQDIRALVRQTARLLAEERLYTYRTNHGFMQNTGLAKLALTFPDLPGMQDYKALAFSRMQEQLGYLFGADAVVLEHSPGYHAFGIGLLDDMIALLAADGQTTPAALVSLRAQALDFLDHILRPDGTLPRIGDTHPDDIMLLAGHEAALPLPGAQAGSGRSAVYPLSGYAVHEAEGGPVSGAPSQLAVFWGYVPYMGHAHANEMSLHLWAAGNDWWTASGYWPYSRDDRSAAICWSGSNAPHLVNEACPGAARTARVLGSTRDGAQFALDLGRDGPDGLKIRRQILSLGADLLLTLDSFEDRASRPARIVWRTDPDSRLLDARDGFFRLRSPDAATDLAVQFLASPQTTLESVRADPGSTIGWAVEGLVRPAHAFVQHLPSRASWALNVSVIEPAQKPRFGGAAAMTRWSGPESWSIRVPLDGQARIVERTGADILVRDAGGQPLSRLTLAPVPENEQIDSKSHAAFKAAQARYGKRFDPYTTYRIRMTGVLLALGALHFLYLFGLRYVPPQARKIGFALPFIAWPGAVLWLMTVYFAQ